jgi:hypothetical protein
MRSLANPIAICGRLPSLQQLRRPGRDSQMADTASLIAQAKAGALPQQWSVFRAQPDSGCSVLFGFGLIFAGVWLIGGVAWALLSSLLPSLWQRFFNTSLDLPFGWWFLLESLLILVPSAYLLVRPWFRSGMVILTDEEAIEYLPERWFRRVQVFDFATIQGMVVHVHYTYGETNMLISTRYGLELRDAHGKQCQ